MSSEHEVSGHQLTLLCGGEEYFPCLLAAIHSARHSIYLEAYIFAADRVGRLVKEALESAAAREVDVHVVLDGFGAADLPLLWLDEMRMLGVQVLWFRPEVARLSFRRQRLRRMHRKLVLIDERIAFVGGINIIEDLSDETHVNRLDYAVEVRGPVVFHITHAMKKLWQLVSWTNLHSSGTRVPRFARQKKEQQEVIFLIRDNLRYRQNIEYAYLNAIFHAQKEIIIANAYFLPGQRFRNALQDAVKRGVRVILLLQGKVDHILMHYATLALYEELLQSGIEIYECTQNLLHAKVAVIDSKWATVGSSNIDPFSLWLAREANLVVQNGAFAVALRASLMHEIQHGARQIVHTAWGKKSFLIRLLSRAGYALAKFLAGMTGYVRKHDNI
jgi:cardiolipin synthase